MAKPNGFLLALMALGVVFAIIFISVGQSPAQTFRTVIDNTKTFFIEDDEPSAGVAKGVSQSIPHNTHTVVTWTQEDFDTDGMVDLVADNTAITIRKTQTYQVTVTLNWQGVAGAGARGTSLWVNGLFKSVQYCPNIPSIETPCTLTKNFPLVDGDVLTVRGWHDRGSALNINGILDRTTFQVIGE